MDYLINNLFTHGWIIIPINPQREDYNQIYIGSNGSLSDVFIDTLQHYGGLHFNNRKMMKPVNQCQLTMIYFMRTKVS